ncbi:histone-lysine N-methyltransferase, H3 lysine-36 specific-like isoform X1 [Senna tora]|uniref:Histone-lysine N-methyltransferase, H3 lysine-36 specific-like isoform X1 n=1 Tax=Senna tora TaxID=362788 RepID=A0A834T793_9FABA|nr:histone-lysine N-methyltransferase, H3 lysine-36 specific-like isoform X1 [Senna tora]
MGKIWIEISLISARGLQRSSSLWKRQWFAVGWIDPDSKYCTKVDDSGNENPFWGTKFAILFDDSESEKNLQDLELNVEVYSIDPIFLTEKIHGSATVILEDFLAKKVQNSKFSLRPENEQVRSYQLRKKDSSKPRGFIDISVRVSKEKEEQNSNPGKKGGTVVLDGGNETHLTAEGALGETHSHQLPLASLHHPENEAEKNVPSSQPLPFPETYTDPYDGGPSYEASRTPSPPPPPSNVGYIPTFLPGNDLLPSSGAASSEKVPPGLAMEALAAGAIIFGDDFMSGFDVLPGIAHDSYHTNAYSFLNKQ